MSSISPNQSPMENYSTMFSEQEEEIIPWVGAFSVPCSESLQNSNGMQFDMSPASFLEESINPVRPVRLPRTTDLTPKELDIAYAWWRSWLWNEKESLDSPKLQHNIFVPDSFTPIDQKTYREIKDFFNNVKKTYPLSRFNKTNPLHILCDATLLEKWSSILREASTPIPGICVCLITNTGQAHHFISKVMRAWGLHQIYCLHSQEVRDFFASRGLEFLQSWDRDLIAAQLPSPSLPEVFRRKLKLSQNNYSVMQSQSRKRSFSNMEENNLPIEEQILPEQNLDLEFEDWVLNCITEFSEGDAELERLELDLDTVDIPTVTDWKGQSNVAFAWWYSWVLEKRKQTHLFQTDALRLGNFKEIRGFLVTSIEKYFLNFLYPQTNLLNISCIPSPLAALQDILTSKATSLQKTPQSLIEEVCVYIMVKATHVDVSRAVCAWGLHQVYLLYNQEVKDLFASKGIEFPQSWDIHLIEQQSSSLYPLRSFQQKLKSLSKAAPSSIGQPPLLYPTQVDRPRLENATKKRPVADMIENGARIVEPRSSITPSQELACQSQEKEEISMQDFNLELEPWISGRFLASDLQDPFGEG